MMLELVFEQWRYVVAMCFVEEGNPVQHDNIKRNKIIMNANLRRKSLTFLLFLVCVCDCDRYACMEAAYQIFF